MSFFVNNMGTIIVVAFLVIILFFIIRTMIKDRKNGKSHSCGGDCSKCNGGCR